MSYIRKTPGAEGTDGGTDGGTGAGGRWAPADGAGVTHRGSAASGGGGLGRRVALSTRGGAHEASGSGCFTRCGGSWQGPDEAQPPRRGGLTERPRRGDR